MTIPPCSCPENYISEPASGTVFGLLRHGITQWNEQRRIQGAEDSPLSQRGIFQTTAWSHCLKNFKWDRILASDLGRVKHTVSILNDTLDLPVTFDQRLQEQHWGSWEGMKIKEVEQQAGETLSRQVEAGWNFTPPQGESRKSVQQRAEAALINAAEKWSGEKILVVCHLGVIKCLLYHIAGRSFLPEEKAMLGKNRLHTIVYLSGNLVLHQHNISPCVKI